MDEPNFSQIVSEYQSVIERCSLFNGLTPKEIQEFFKKVQTESFPAATEILTEGKTYQGLWILLRGRCEVIKKGHQNASKLATLEPANIFGEMTFLAATPHSATIKAIEEVKTVRILYDDFQQLSQAFPNLGLTITSNIVNVLSDRLRRMDEWTCELVENNANSGKTEWQEFRSKLYSNLFE